MSTSIRVLLGWLGLALSGRAHAAECEPVAWSEPVRLSVLSASPGLSVNSRFGHTGLWLYSEAMGQDVVFNWGSYDSAVQEPVSGFLDGSLRYELEVEPRDKTVRDFARQDRRVVAQQLLLPEPARDRLLEALTREAQAADRSYAYEYFDDNCTTKVRDLLDEALQGELRAQRSGPIEPSLRDEIIRHVAADPLLWVGVQAVGNDEIDIELDRWSSLFLPDRFMLALDEATIGAGDGTQTPLVGETCTLHPGALPWRPGETPDRGIAFGVVGAALAGLLALLGRASRSSRVARVAGGAVLATIGLGAGVLGTAIALLTVGGQVRGVRGNENLFVLSPLSCFWLIAGLGLVFDARWCRGRARTIALVIAGLGMVGVLVQPIPGLDQVNGAILALFLPTWIVAAGWLWGRAPQAGIDGGLSDDRG